MTHRVQPVQVAQLSAAEVPACGWDCVIAGAGPAGSAAAIGLAARGHRVLLVDRERFPREKICGEGLIADAIAALRRLGAWEEVREAAHSVLGLTVFSPSRIQVDAGGEYVTLRRSVLDALLARQAVAHGAVFASGEVQSFSVASGGAVEGWIRDGSERVRVRARVAIIATGTRLALADVLGMVPLGRRRPDAVAIRCRVRSEAKVERLIASFDRSVLPGYAWIFPLGEGEYNVGCGIFRGDRRGQAPNLAQTFSRFVTNFPMAREVWERGQRISPLRGAPLRCGFKGAEPLGPGNILAVGEAMGGTFPFTGEGIGKALETGELASQVIHHALTADDMELLRSYVDRLSREIRPKYLGYEIAEKWLARPWVIDFLARRVRKSRRLARAAGSILRETADPREIFSLAGVVRSLLS